MENMIEFVKPELTIVILVLWILGYFLKNAKTVKDNLIPFVLLVVGIGVAALWVFATSALGTPQDLALALFAAITQGVVVTGVAVLGNQLVKQAQKSQ